MKKLFILAILIASLASAALGQVNISTFFTLSSADKSANLKGKIGIGLDFSANIKEFWGLGIQVGKQDWGLNGMEERIASLQTYSLQFFICESAKEKSGWFFQPLGGIMTGFGSQISDGSQNQKERRQKLSLMKHPYFLGLFSQANVCKKISQKITLKAYVRFEGLVGKMANREMATENFSTNSNLFVGFGGACDL